MDNKFWIGSNGHLITFGRPIPQWLSMEDALALAAWLVTMAEPFAKVKFEDILKDVQST